MLWAYTFGHAVLPFVILDSYRPDFSSRCPESLLSPIDSEWQQKKIRNNMTKNMEVWFYCIVFTFKDISSERVFFQSQTRNEDQLSSHFNPLKTKRICFI
jgi:hypothetical protein